MQLPPDAVGHLPNCGLTAMAIVANVSLAEATEAYQKSHFDITGKNKRSNWKGRTFDDVRQHALKNYLNVELEYRFIRGMTLARCCRLLAQDGVYLVVTTGHVQVVEKRGELPVMVADQGGTVTLSTYWGNRKKVKQIWRVK